MNFNKYPGLKAALKAAWKKEKELMARSGATGWGCTYSTEKEDFGKITHLFQVNSSWEGYRYHGYKSVDEKEAMLAIAEAVVWRYALSLQSRKECLELAKQWVEAHK